MLFPRDDQIARITTVIATSHSPFLFNLPETWNAVRDKRPFGEGVPFDDLEANRAKFACTEAAFATVRNAFQANKPNVMVVFGDDQKEQFDFKNFPSFGSPRGMGFAYWNMWPLEHLLNGGWSFPHAISLCLKVEVRHYAP